MAAAGVIKTTKLYGTVMAPRKVLHKKSASPRHQNVMAATTWRSGDPSAGLKRPRPPIRFAPMDIKQDALAAIGTRPSSA